MSKATDLLCRPVDPMPQATRSLALPWEAYHALPGALDLRTSLIHCARVADLVPALPAVADLALFHLDEIVVGRGDATAHAVFLAALIEGASVLADDPRRQVPRRRARVFDDVCADIAQAAEAALLLRRRFDAGSL